MKRTSFILLALIGSFSFTVWAQTKDKDAKLPKVIPIPVYFGKTNIADGHVKERVFDSLLRQGLTSRDSTGKVYRVNGFIFTYGERNLYEDSVGKLMMLTDNLAEFCYGDSLTSFLVNNIRERSKPGDTVYFDNISLLSPEGYGAAGKPFRIVIDK